MPEGILYIHTGRVAVTEMSEQSARWWPLWITVAQTLVAGTVGVAGAVIGARMAGQEQAKVEQQKQRLRGTQIRADKAEEIISLIEKTPQTLIDAKRVMYFAPGHIFTPPC